MQAKIVSPVIRQVVVEKKLTTADRQHVKKSHEAFPSKHGKVGSYPMPNKSHAQAAIGLCSMHNGAGSAKCKTVRAKAKSLGY